MTTIKRGSQARSTYNEDFSYDAELPGRRGFLLAVGDFSSSKYTDLDRLAENQLGVITESQASAGVPPSLLLTSLAVEFNNRLLDYKESFPDMSFQCCAAFAAVAEDGLHYLTVGDCRVNVLRGESLILLNGSGWVDPKGKPLTNVVARGQEMKRGYEEPPGRVLGSTQVSYDLAEVRHFQLETSDTVLMYSDGVEKAVPPARLLDLVLGEGGNPERVVARVLDEVLARQGDDDRTLLVAAGPHPVPPSEAREEAVRSALARQQGQEERLKKTIDEQQRQAEELRQKGALLEQSLAAQRAAGAELKALSERVQTLDKIFNYVSAIDKNTKTIYEVLKDLPRDQSIASAIQRALVNTPQRDERSLHELTEKVDRIARLLAAGEEASAGDKPPKIIRRNDDRREMVTGPNNQDRNDGGHPHSAARGKGKKGQRAGEADPSETIRGCPPAGGDLRPQTHASAEFPFREGVIHVTQDRIELLDETEVPEDGFAPDGRPGELFMFPPEGAPPGWLTAAYLYLRHLDSLEGNGGGSKPLPSFEQLDRLRPDLLMRLRKWHWRLRERRRAGRASEKVEKSLRDDEAKVTGNLFHQGRVVQNAELINLAPPEAGGIYLRGQQRWKEFVATPFGLVIFSALIASVSLLICGTAAWLFWGKGASGGAQTGANQNASVPAGEGNFSVEYGADGRAIILTDGENRLGTSLRLPYLHETALSQIFSTMRFSGVKEAARRLKEAAREKGLSLTDVGPPPEQYAVYSVAEANDDRCSKLLSRINTVELARSRVHMELSDLESMNPGLRCGELAVGDKVLGKSKNWK